MGSQSQSAPSTADRLVLVTALGFGLGFADAALAWWWIKDAGHMSTTEFGTWARVTGTSCILLVVAAVAAGRSHRRVTMVMLLSAVSGAGAWMLWEFWFAISNSE